MQLISLQQINNFVSGSSIAIAGASRNPKSFSAEVAKHLGIQNYKLWFVNPNFEKSELEDKKVNSVLDLPQDVKHLLVLTPATETESVVNEAIGKGINNIWIQQKSETTAAIELAHQNKVNLIHHHCIFMFTNPTGIHKFHRNIKKVFGSLPK
jgi:predicted CoA-binding protein